MTYAVVTGFILGYFLNGLFYERETFIEVLRNPSMFFSTWLGLSSYGGFFGGILGCFIWSYRKKMPLLPYANAVCFGLPFGWFFGRMGCFVVHDHPGKVTDFALAVSDYRFGAPPFQPRHDLGFYEVLYSARSSRSSFGSSTESAARLASTVFSSRSCTRRFASFSTSSGPLPSRAVTSGTPG